MKDEFKHICVPDRKNTNSRKWDNIQEVFGRDDLVPLWVADMDFKVPDGVIDALQKYVSDGLFGYYMPTDGYYENFIKWQKDRHGYDVKKEWIRFSPGVALAVHLMIQMHTEVNDSVIILSPVYYPFMDAVIDTNRNLVCCPMTNNDGIYTVNFELFEKNIVENKVKMYIMSSPHNPVGRVWKKEELVKMFDICKKHNVLILADELHQDIIFAGNKHLPAATVGDYSEILISMTAGSKTFNLSGCQNSYIIIEDEKLRNCYDDYLKYLRIKSGNNFGYIAVEAAYKTGHKWLEAVLEEIYSNFCYLRDELTKEFPKVKVTPLEGTYLMWFDLGAYVDHDELEEFVKNDCKLAVDFGDWFWPEGMKNDTNIRLNLATPFENIKKVTELLIAGLKNKTK